jgi:hypothetical protein
MMYKIARYDKTKKIELDSCVVGRTDLLDILNVVLGHDPKHRMIDRKSVGRERV